MCVNHARGVVFNMYPVFHVCVYLFVQFAGCMASWFDACHLHECIQAACGISSERLQSWPKPCTLTATPQVTPLLFNFAWLYVLFTVNHLWWSIRLFSWIIENCSWSSTAWAPKPKKNILKALFEKISAQVLHHSAPNGGKTEQIFEACCEILPVSIVRLWAQNHSFNTFHYTFFLRVKEQQDDIHISHIT